MRYVNPLVEGSSPSPVNQSENTENIGKARRKAGFLMRLRVAPTLPGESAQVHQNSPKSDQCATAGATFPNEGIRNSLPDDLAVVVDSWDQLPEALRVRNQGDGSRVEGRLSPSSRLAARSLISRNGFTTGFAVLGCWTMVPCSSMFAWASLVSQKAVCVHGGAGLGFAAGDELGDDFGFAHFDHGFVPANIFNWLIFQRSIDAGRALGVGVGIFPGRGPAARSRSAPRGRSPRLLR